MHVSYRLRAISAETGPFRPVSPTLPPSVVAPPLAGTHILEIRIDFASLLQRSADGGKDGLDQVVRTVYTELRSLARHRLRGAPAERSLNTTGLVHEVYLRLVESDAPVHDRDHFLAIASRAMQFTVSAADRFSERFQHRRE